MLRSLIVKEIVNNVLSLRFMVTFVLFFVLILVSIFVLTDNYRSALRAHEASETDSRDRLNDVLEDSDDSQSFNKLFHDNILYDQGVYEGRAPLPLGIFVSGLEAELPIQVNTRLGGPARIFNEGYFRNPLFELFATPDYSYFVNIVVSLLALLFVFDAVCGEKERGTLKLLLANSVPRDLVLLGKWIGGYISLAAPFLIAVLGGVTYVYLVGALQFTDEVVARLLWIVGVSLLYISLFFALGMFISTATHKASTALLVALFVWVCWILVIPNLTPVIARIVSPVPTLQKINAEKTAIDRETNIRVTRLSRNMLYYGKKAQDKRGKIYEEGTKRKRRLDQFYQDKLQTQIRVSKVLSRISPSASFIYASNDLAGTGVGLFDSFKRAYKRLGEEYREWGGDWDHKYHDDTLGDNWFQEGQIPGLTVVHKRLDDTISVILMDILLLLVFNVLFFMLTYLCFLRYDVT